MLGNVLALDICNNKVPHLHRVYILMEETGYGQTNVTYISEKNTKSGEK